MAEDPDHPNVPLATVVPKKRTRISIVWIIPILAAVVAVGIAVQRILNEGPEITIIFKAAGGLEPGKTFVKYKDVNIGQVTAVQLATDYSQVEVTAKIAKRAAGLMVKDARFWVVEPRVTLSGISGLGTILSGNFIGFEAGKSTEKQTEFTGVETPPIITGGQPGKEFLLEAEDLGSLGVGSPIYYRRLQAGQVTAFELTGDGKGIQLKVFVNAPYDKYVSQGTRFWNASGIDVSVGAGGFEVRTQSFVSLLAGGVAFDTPTFAVKAEPAAADTVFSLYRDRTTAMRQPESVAQHYVLYFNDSLRGLSVGAPVTVLGLVAGEVADIRLDLNHDTMDLRGRVEIIAYPERLVQRLTPMKPGEREELAKSVQERHVLLRHLVEQRGLRGQLNSGSLLTGQLYVAFDFFPNATPVKMDWTPEMPELPVVPSTLPDLEEKITSIMAKLEKLPYDTIGADAAKALGTLDETLQSANKVMTRLDADLTPGLKETLDELRRMIATAEDTLKGKLSTTLTDVNTLLEDLRRPIASADAMFKNTDATLLGKDAPVQLELRDALQEIARAARSMSVLSDYLERHPEALLRGKEGSP